MSRRSAFTLLELVIVILILGIIAAVAVPRMANQTKTAKDNSARQSLGILRNALELYNTKNDGYPQDTNLATALAGYLHGPFPAPGVGYHPTSNAVSSGTTPSNSITAGWLYEPATGVLKINGGEPYGSW